jgi:hypothetical protein
MNFDKINSALKTLIQEIESLQSQAKTNPVASIPSSPAPAPAPAPAPVPVKRRGPKKIADMTAQELEAHEAKKALKDVASTASGGTSSIVNSVFNPFDDFAPAAPPPASPAPIVAALSEKKQSGGALLQRIDALDPQINEANWKTKVFSNEDVLLTVHLNGIPDAKELLGHRFKICMEGASFKHFFDPTSGTTFGTPSGLCKAKLKRKSKEAKTDEWRGPFLCLVQRNGTWTQLAKL